MEEPPTARPDPRIALFEGLPRPVCLVDGHGRLLAVNRKGEAFWGAGVRERVGMPAMEALRIETTEGDGAPWERLAAPTARLRCHVTGADGQRRLTSLLYSPLGGTEPPISVLFLLDGPMSDIFGDLPAWALRDPVTGLGNRALWEREAPAWAQRSGCVAFLNLEDLKEVNHLHGHLAGDRVLAFFGRALTASLPRQSLAVRYGGDEFVVLADGDAAAAEAWAQQVVRHVAATASSADLPLIPHLSYGVAAFGPGGLLEGVQRADAALYERKGILVRAASGGHIILTRKGHAAVLGPEDRDQPGTPGRSFGPEFEGYFRDQFTRSLEQAREFVGFADPEPGSAVVEVGAGSGRVTFEGGLAERVGPRGCLLVADPSGAQVQACRRHAAERQLTFLRFLRAPAEELPLVSGTVDLAIGALFLHFTDPLDAVREMARILRPGGRVAICAGRAFDWPDPWVEVLEPVRRELAALGLPLRHYFLQPGELEHLMTTAGLRVERAQQVGPELWQFPSVELGIALWRQLGLIPLMLREVPASRHPAVQEAFEHRFRALFSGRPRESWAIPTLLDSVVAAKPR